jgi:nucleotide-binding universal stress UspA family protein
MTNGTLHILHVASQLDLPPAKLPPGEELRPGMRSWVEEQLHRMAENEVPKAVRYQAMVREGNPHHEILKVAKELQADLIVMGPRGKTGLAQFLIGSVAERVVRHAHCPVLTVRDLEAQEKFDES